MQFNAMTRRCAQSAVVVALAAALVTAPAAPAQPADMHASVAQAAADARAKQDLRSPDARAAAVRSVNAPGATAVDSATRPAPSDPFPGPPTWPVDPQPVTQARTATPNEGGNGLDWTTIGLGIAGSLLAVSGLAAIAGRRSRKLQRAAA